MSNESRHLGGQMRAGREKLSMSATQIADILGCHITTINAIERGERIGNYMMKYLFFLRKRGMDLNRFFDIGEGTEP